MKKTIAMIMMLAALTPQAFASAPVSVPTVSGTTITREGNYLRVSMDIPFDSLGVESNRAVMLTPVLANGNDSTELSSLGIYGRSRYIYYQRGSEAAAADKIWRASEAPATYSYTALVPWQEWMNGSTLSLSRTDYGCCANIEGEARRPLASFELPRPFEPMFQYVRPVAETVKSRSVTGRAFIDFPVNRTEIYPEYRRNTTELAKIRATIDSVAGDKDITVRSISIKGFASPEGPYNNNVRLAKGRTEALKDYVIGLYHFPADLFTTSSEPEDWQGLTDWLEANEIENRQGILAIARDNSLQPDPRDRKIKTDYPRQYAWLLANVYPALRHSDYTIDFDIRSFTDIEEIKRLVRTAPQKLSLNEFFMAAQTYEPGSAEFNNLFDTAVRMYPDSDIANLNAANAAMNRRDLTTAAAYLDKAGDSPEATYARGILAALSGDNERALDLFRQAARLRVSDAPAAIDQIERIMRANGQQPITAN